jgi:aldehyde:ferredoxin oxidoreductase
MRYAETGYNLEIDLATGNIERVETDPRLMETHLGGLGTDVKLFWDRVPPETKAFDPENLLVFSSGVLCGTPAWSTNRTICSTISPQTDLLAYPMMGGFWSAELKYAGYDKVILRNKAHQLVYIWIHNDKVEIRDATHLKGRGAIETQDLIRQELNQPDAQVSAIGPAGENRVFFASIEQSRSSASRLGSGGVMGDKNVKAIAVRGTKDINLYDGLKLMEHLEELKKFVVHRNANPLQGIEMVIHSGVGSPQAMKYVDESWHTQGFSWGHARTRKKNFWTDEIYERWSKSHWSAVKRFISCYNCPQQCGALISFEDVPRYMMKCFSKLSYLFGAETDNMDFTWRILNKAFEYGVDSFSTPQVLAFAVELYEAGILTDADFKGCPTDNEGRFFWLLDRVAHREGIGDVLADGVYWAARRIGNGAEVFDHNTTKKHEQMVVKLGMFDPLYFLMFATNEKASITQIEGNWPQTAKGTEEAKEKWAKDWIQVPDQRFIDYFKGWNPRGEGSNPYYPTPQMCCEIVDWMETLHNIDDAIGLCAGMGSFCYKPGYHVHNYHKFVSAATGLDLDQDSLKKIIHRNRNLHRAFNNRRGMTRADEKPPEDHWKHRFPELEEELLTTYYKFKGWNYDGIPTKERLHELDLDYVAEDLTKRGILKDGQD